MMLIITIPILSKLCLTLSQMTNFSHFRTESFADDNYEFNEMVDSSPKAKKTVWEKEKLLVMSFSFSHSVFYPFG